MLVLFLCSETHGGYCIKIISVLEEKNAGKYNIFQHLLLFILNNQVNSYDLVINEPTLRRSSLLVEVRLDCMKIL